MSKSKGTIILLSIILSASYCQAQNSLDIKPFVGGNLLDSEVPSSIGYNLGIALEKRQEHVDLSLTLGHTLMHRNKKEISASSNGSNVAPTEVSYYFKNNALYGYVQANVHFIYSIRLNLGIGLLRSSAIGGFSNSGDAQTYYKSWGSTYFKGIDANGNETTDINGIVDAQTSYKGRNLIIPIGIDYHYKKFGIHYNYLWSRSNALDAFSFPEPRNRYADQIHTVTISYKLKSFEQKNKIPKGISAVKINDTTNQSNEIPKIKEVPKPYKTVPLTSAGSSIYTINGQVNSEQQKINLDPKVDVTFISQDLVQKWIEKGVIYNSEIKDTDDDEQYIMIKSIEIGGIILKNVTAFVNPGMEEDFVLNCNLIREHIYMGIDFDNRKITIFR